MICSFVDYIIVFISVILFMGSHFFRIVTWRYMTQKLYRTTVRDLTAPIFQWFTGRRSGQCSLETCCYLLNFPKQWASRMNIWIPVTFHHASTRGLDVGKTRWIQPSPSHHHSFLGFQPSKYGWFMILVYPNYSKYPQGGAPPSYKLVYNPNNYRYNPHKP